MGFVAFDISVVVASASILRTNSSVVIYAEITDIDYSYGEFEFARKIMSSKFDSSYRNLITDCSIDETFEYLVDTNDKYYTDIYVLQKSTDNVRLVARLAENGDYYKEYCADNIDSAPKYFIDKMEKKYL